MMTRHRNARLCARDRHMKFISTVKSKLIDGHKQRPRGPDGCVIKQKVRRSNQQSFFVEYAGSTSEKKVAASWGGRAMRFIIEEKNALPLWIKGEASMVTFMCKKNNQSQAQKIASGVTFHLASDAVIELAFLATGKEFLGMGLARWTISSGARELHSSGIALDTVVVVQSCPTAVGMYTSCSFVVASSRRREELESNLRHDWETSCVFMETTLGALIGCTSNRLITSGFLDVVWEGETFPDVMIVGETFPDVMIVGETFPDVLIVD